MLGIAIAAALLLGLFVSVALVVRDTRRMHRAGRRLTAGSADAAGVSAAAMTVIGNSLTH